MRWPIGGSSWIFNFDSFAIGCLTEIQTQSSPTDDPFAIHRTPCATATIAPSGSQSIGSNLNISSGATATFTVGRITFTNSAAISLDSSSAAVFDTSGGDVDCVQDAGAMNNLSGTTTIGNGATTTFGKTNNEGTLSIVGGSTLECSGTTSSYLQSMGSAITSIENGSKLIVANRAVISAGKLSTIAKASPPPGFTQAATLQGDLIFQGGDLYIDEGSLSPHVFGTFRVTGNVTWSGGAFHLLVDASVPGHADLWSVGGTMTVDTTGTAPPTYAAGVASGSLPASTVWPTITAAGGITLTGTAYPAAGSLFTVLPATGGLTWNLKS
jgi:hypothetical protein